MALDLKPFLSNLKTKTEKDGIRVFDPVRRKWVAFTPEEMVRQAAVQFLLEVKGYSLRLMNVEKGIRFHDLGKRYDMVVYNQSGDARILIECKAPDIALDQSAADQVSLYNQILKVGHIWITNGHHHLIFKLDPDKQKMVPAADLPHSSHEIRG